MEGDCCAHCVHFKSNDPGILREYGPDFGLCRYGPPVVNHAPPPDPPVHPPVWPVVAKTYWCPAFRQAE